MLWRIKRWHHDEERVRALLFTGNLKSLKPQKGQDFAEKTIRKVRNCLNHQKRTLATGVTRSSLIIQESTERDRNSFRAQTKTQKA